MGAKGKLPSGNGTADAKRKNSGEKRTTQTQPIPKGRNTANEGQSTEHQPHGCQETPYHFSNREPNIKTNHRGCPRKVTTRGQPNDDGFRQAKILDPMGETNGKGHGGKVYNMIRIQGTSTAAADENATRSC